MDVSECPGNTRNGQPAGYSGVFIHIPRIVVIDEVVPQRLAENTPREQCKTDANAERNPQTARRSDSV
jgi:hypothetical protein